MNKISITAIIMTYNEEIHLKRCLISLKNICNEIIVIDSYSNDLTIEIAKDYGARLYQNKWINYATQFNWAIENVKINSDWILRIDADEFLSNELIVDLNKLVNVGKEINGITINRLMYFMDKPLMYGGMYPIKHLRIFRNGFGKCEERWMDERIILSSGDTIHINSDLVDYNKNNLSWWIAKHNSYSTREAIDLLNYKHNFFDSFISKNDLRNNGMLRRKLKRIYSKLPLFIRPFLFFFVRYFIQLAFLDGKRGLIWTFLQCFWYRFLIDAKIYEANLASGKDKEKLIKYFKQNFNYDITKSS
tara:strand:+ start:12512 stop:13423 length:912 start_codon:yes stop_codon:yes gene_type:complete